MSAVEGRVKEVIVDSRINKVLAMHTDSVAMLEALDAISEFYGKEGNTLDARRSLRQDLELQNINLAKKFLIEYGEVRARVENVEQHAKDLEAACNMLSSKVSSAGDNMKAFMEKASDLESRKNTYLEQSKEINSFLGRFQLSDEEVETLHKAPLEQPSRAKAFFDALHRLRIAYADCKCMVENHRYSAGFELLDVLGQHQDVAYQRLFEWVKTKCESLSESSQIEDIDNALQMAIRYLRDLPIYYSQCQDLVISARRTQLVQKFIIALSQGGPNGQTYRAIDMHAHDAVRYVGDMLAWMHQTVATEEEFLEAMFGIDNGTTRTDATRKETRRRKTGSSDPTASITSSPRSHAASVVAEYPLIGLSQAELLGRCLQGLGRPLRARIMQTLDGSSTRTSLDVLYTLTDLLAFYETTLARILPMENAVHSAVKGSLLECRRAFLSALNKQAESLVQSPSSYPLDLSTSHVTKECARQIQEVLRVYASALSSVPVEASDDCSIDSVLGCIIQPLLQSCRISGQALQGPDMATFMLNNVSVIQVCGRYMIDYLL